MSSRVPQIAVLDTHAFWWWLDGDMRKLGRAARAFVERVDEGRAVAVIPALVLTELSEAICIGRFALSEPFSVFVDRLAHTPSRYRIAPLDSAVIAASHNLFSIPERGDRLIAATAKVLGMPLFSRDDTIANVAEIEVLW